jgi:hypothetical protein
MKDDNQVHGNPKNLRTTKNNIKIVQINVEGLTRAKADILSKIFSEVDVLNIKEIHVLEGEISYLKIIGFNLVNYIGHKKHELAAYIKQKKVMERVEGNVYTVMRYSNRQPD